MFNRDKAIGDVVSVCGAKAKKGVFRSFLPWFRVETYVVAGRNRRIWLCKEALFVLQRSLLFPLIKPCLHSDAVLVHDSAACLGLENSIFQVLRVKLFYFFARFLSYIRVVPHGVSPHAVHAFCASASIFVPMLVCLWRDGCRR